MNNTVQPCVTNCRCGACIQQRRAKAVRDAINAIALDSEHVGWWHALAERETDANLANLRRLLR